MWHQPCQRCRYTTSVDIQKRAIIKLVIHVELRVSVVSLLESGEQRYIKAVIIICQLSREPLWPSGKALGWYAEGPRFDTASALLSLQKLWFVDTVL